MLQKNVALVRTNIARQNNIITLQNNIIRHTTILQSMKPCCIITKRHYKTQNNIVTYKTTIQRYKK